MFQIRSKCVLEVYRKFKKCSRVSQGYFTMVQRSFKVVTWNMEVSTKFEKYFKIATGVCYDFSKKSQGYFKKVSKNFKATRAEEWLV